LPYIQAGGYRKVLGNTRNLFRLITISRVLAKHNALFFLDEMNVPSSLIFLSGIFSSRKNDLPKGQRLANAFIELGPTFVKFGQALSVRPDVVGEEVAKDLSKLQDKMESFPFEEARAIIESDFSGKLEDFFDGFEETPVAAASIAQVHFANGKNGEMFAVKVLRPGIEEAFKRDINFFYWLADKVHRNVPRARRLKLREVVRTFEQSVKFEMDLRLEAAAASELKENFVNDNDLKIPEINWQMTSRHVMVMERISGINIDDREALLAAGHDIKEILRKTSDIFFKQVFRDGFFHADMHPGNLFVDSEGKIVAVDFGIMGRLDRKTRLFIAEMLHGFLNRDYKKVADVHFEAGYTPSHKSRELFAQACRSIGEPIFGRPQNEISMAILLAQLFKISEDFEMETQPQLLLLQKTMVAIEGIWRMLDKQSNFWELSRPVVEKWGKENLGMEAKIKDKANELKNLGKKLNSAAQVIEFIPDIFTKDGVKLHPDTVDLFASKKNNGNGKMIIIVALIIALAGIIIL